MKEQDMLYFEEDDTSGIGLDGKQVFVAKRINGKTSRNKSNEEERTFNNKKNNSFDISKNIDSSGILDEEIFIGIENKKVSKEKKNSKKSNKNIKNSKDKKNNKSRNVKSNKSSKRIKKKQMPKKKNKKIFKIFIVIIVFCVAIVFALVSPIFSIQKIEVKGNNKVSTDTIISLSSLEKGKNIFQNLKSKIIDNIEENQYLESVEVHRILPDTIEITVNERQVAYQVKVVDSYAYLNDEGYILEVSNVACKAPFLEGLSTSEEKILKNNRVSKEDLKYLNKILKIIENTKNIGIDKLITKIILEDGKYILYLKSEKKYVYLGDGNDLTNKILYLQSILENEKGKSGKIMLDGNINDGFKPRFREE